ncbi:MAG: DUF6088 family protein [Pirellulaceae bacterium]
MQSVSDKIVKRIKRRGQGTAFSSKEFLDIGSRASVDKALSQLTSRGQIRRVCRGIYDYPRFNAMLGGMLGPDYDQVAHAIARSGGNRIRPSGAWAANALGLSTQVPGQIVYLTDGVSRDYRIGNQTIQFKRTPNRNVSLGEDLPSLVIQALIYLGPNQIDERVIRHLRHRLNREDRQRVLRLARGLGDWIHQAAKQIATEVEVASHG